MSPPGSCARRAMLGATAALLLAPGCASTGGPASLRAVEVAPGVHLLPGARGEVGPHNLGRVGNAGFIVGPSGVIAIEAGVSYLHGRALLAEIEHATPLPVRAVLITQARQEFVFGAAAFRERGIPIHMHRRASLLMRSRCETCLATLQRTLGDAAMRGTAIVRPDVEFDGDHELGEAGRSVRVLHFGHSSGPGDVAVLDPQSRTLFAGGLLEDRRVPDLQNADLAGWLHALAKLRGLNPQTIVPGHGAPVGAASIDAVERYLRELQRRIRALVDDGAALSAVPDAASLPEFERWDQYDPIHRRNAAVLFLKFEQELLHAR